MDDFTYIELFKKIMTIIMSSYRPDVLVIQCGADSLSKDKLGHLNLSIKGHAECINHMMSYNTPMVLLGGGGYTIENVSRCWAYETAMVLGK
jgi:histone deacetylase 1/2